MILTQPIIIGESNLTPAQSRYWTALARKMIGRVDIIDPWRGNLRDRRAEYPGRSIYRASTGGRYGKSAEIVKL